MLANRVFFVFLALLTGASFQVEAQAITAASCNASDVQAALGKVTSATTTVNIPAGTCTWSSNVSFTVPSGSTSLTLQGQSTVTGSCAPGGSCTPTDATTINLGNAVQFTVNTVSGGLFRLTGLTFNPGGSTAEYGSLTFKGPGQIRVDHNHINDTVSGDHTLQPDQVTGVIDHNFFDSTNDSNLFFIQPTIDGTDGESNATWTVAENFGTSAFLYVENNFFQNGAFLFDCDFGGRIVFRFNTGWYNTRIQTHGVGSGAQRRGCRAMEIYENTFTYSSSPNTSSFAFLVDYESGPLLFWGNSVTGFVTMLREQEVRADNATYAQTATPSGWGYCGTAYDGTGSNWDQNSNSSTGYACLDQVGRGAGQLLTGSFPSLVNSTTGTIAWPNQTLVPTYSWMNAQTSNSYATNHFWQTYETPVRVTENVDYYNQYPNADHSGSFTGAGGTGYGTLSARPSTCTTGVVYWDTSEGTWNNGAAGSGALDKCTATNTWTSAAYTPYAYPHPLESTTPTPMPPTLNTPSVNPQ